MRELVSKTQVHFTSKIGRCTTCMRQSLTVAVAAWVAFGIASLVWPHGLVQTLTGVSAAGLTALWTLHVATYAARVMAETRNDRERSNGHPAARAALVRREPDVEPIGRRRALGVMVRAAGIGVVASVPVMLWPSESYAFCGQCTKNADCGVGYVCRNTAPVNSGKVCNECVKG